MANFPAILRVFGYFWLLYMSTYICLCDVDMYIELERPLVTYYNRRYYSNVTVKSTRYSRNDPIHYASAYFTTLLPLDDNVKAHLYFYELLTNVYKPSFIEFHYTCCQFVNDEVIGVYFRNYYNTHLNQSGGLSKCPIPPGDYSVVNMSFPPNKYLKNFPFTYGRIYLNITHQQELVLSGQIDMELKKYPKTKNRKS